MSSLLEKVSRFSFFASSAFCTDFGSFGVGILSWMESISESVEERSLLNLFLRSCFCLARILRLFNRFRVLRRSAWLFRMFDLFNLYVFGLTERKSSSLEAILNLTENFGVYF